MTSATSSMSEGDKQRHNTAQVKPLGMAAGGTVVPAAQGRVEDQINDQHLRRIERMFREADTAGGGGLDMAQFRDAMKKVMEDIDDEDVDIIFMKVDTNCDGSVSWTEYLHYMLLEYRQKDCLEQQNRPLYFPKPLKLVPVVCIAHRRLIVSLQFYTLQPPAGEKTAESEEQGGASGGRKARLHAGRYLSISRDGVLNYWSERFMLLRTISQMQHTIGQPVWVTAMVCLSHLNLLAISSTGRDVEFYDISASKCDVVFSLSELEANVTVMDYWTNGRKGVYSIGDTSGTMFVFVSLDVVLNGLFNSSSAFKTGGNYRLPVTALLKNTSTSFLCFRVSIHNDWIRQIRFIPALNAIASCCAAEQTAMVLTTMPHSHKSKTQTTHFHLQTGILCFDYSPELHILVTGGIDMMVQVWNPYVTNQPTCQLKGHSAVVTHIAVNGRDNKIISVSKDKNMRVWDLQHYACLQNIQAKNVNLGRCPVSCTYYHRTSNSMVLATYIIGVFRGAMEYLDVAQPDQPLSRSTQTSHEQPLCTALYNPNFKQVVSGCHAGVVSVWDILTGLKVMQFQTNPERPVEVTAMAFDGPKRRLITGSKDGALRLWNFNNGALLLKLPMVDKNEVTGILYINERIYASGWSKRVMWYLDNKRQEGVEHRVWNQYHSEDVYSMTAHGNKMLATASYSGDIIVWNTHSGHAFCRLNASESPLPLMPVRVLFLDTRERSPDTAVLLSSSADGFVYAWSISHDGGLLGKFCAVRQEGPVICAMSTDSQDQILLTGDSNGYVMLWDIERYCYRMKGGASEEEASNQDVRRLPKLIPRYCKVEGPQKQVLDGETEMLQGSTVSLTPPKLLSSWRCHLKRVVHLEYVERFHLIVTASLDCNVRLWTITGRYIGTFGQGLWSVGDPGAGPRQLPGDVKVVGSRQTLKVLNQGEYPLWSCPQKRQQSCASTVSGEAAPPLSQLVPTDPRIAQYSDEQVEHTWRLWQEKGKQTSHILGRAYKQRVRHHLPSCAPALQMTFSSQEQLRVYKAMPYTSLLPILQPPVPELLQGNQQRTLLGTETSAKQKRSPRRCWPHTRFLAASPRSGDKLSPTSRGT